VIRILVAFLALSAALFSQENVQTFTNPNGIFQFTHLQALVHCVGEGGSWAPSEDCSSQGGLCDDVLSSGTLVCFAYPKQKFTTKPAFGGAAFFVAEIKKATTEKACLAGEDWLVRRSEKTTINGVPFKVFHISDAWMSGSQDGDIFRTFREKRCYELGIQQVWVSTGGFDAGPFEEFTKDDERVVRIALEQVLDSFRFLK